MYVCMYVHLCACVCAAVSPVGLAGYGLAAGEVAEQSQRGLSYSDRKRLSRLTFLLVRQMDPVGMLGARSTGTCE